MAEALQPLKARRIRRSARLGHGPSTRSAAAAVGFKIVTVRPHQPDPAAIEDRVRSICLALPGAEERASHGSPAFFAGRQFVMLWPSGHHDHQFPHLWCAAPPGAQEELASTEPDRFFRPPYVGHRGWIAVRLDGDVDWNEVASICAEAHQLIAPARFRRQNPV